MFDIVIIGNGVLGMSTAFDLQEREPDLKIAIIGPKTNPGSASHAAGAMLGCFGEVTQQTFSSPAHQEKFHLSLTAKNLWSNWIDKINDRSPLENKIQQKLGTYVILNTKSGELDCENFAEIATALKKYQEPHDRVKPSEVPGLEPVTDCRSTNAIYLPQEGYINPEQLFEHLSAILEKNNNIEFIDDTVISIQQQAECINHIETSLGRKISANKFLLAAGSFSQDIIDQLPSIKHKIPRLFYGLGFSIITEDNDFDIEHVIRTPNRGFACGLHILPHAQQGIFLGSTNTVILKPQVSPRAGYIHFLLECAFTQINHRLQKSSIIKSQVGHRPVAADTFPLIGKTSLDNLWLLTGTYRDGFHQSPYLAQSIAGELLGEPALTSPLFFPERKHIQTKTREQSVAEVVQHHHASAYEQSLSLPKVGWQPMLSEMLHARINKIYDDIGIPDLVLPTDFFLLFDDNYQKDIETFRAYYQNVEHKLVQFEKAKTSEKVPV